MNIKQKRLLSLLLAVVLAAFSFCGCSEDAPDPSSANPLSIDVNETDEDGRVTLNVYDTWCWVYNDLLDFFECESLSGDAHIDSSKGEYVKLFAPESMGGAEVTDLYANISDKMTAKVFSQDGSVRSTFIIKYISTIDMNATPTDTSANENDPQKTVITLLADPNNTAVLTAVENFNRENKDFVIEFMSASYTMPTLSQLRRAVNASRCADIVYLDSTTLLAAAQEGLIADLYTVGAQKDEELFINSCFSALTKGVNIYGLPFDAETVCLAYNEDIFNFVDIDSPPETFTELLDIAKLVKTEYSDKTSSFGLDLSPDAAAELFISWLYRLGGDLFSNDMSSAVFHEHEGVEALELLVELVNSGVSSNNWDSDDFYSGKTALFEVPSDNYRSVFGSHATANFAAAAPVKLCDEEGLPSLITLNAFALTRPCSEDYSKFDAAYDFISSLCTDVDSVAEFCSEEYRLPTLVDAYDLNRFNKQGYDVFFSQLENGRSINGVAGWSAIEEYIREAVISALSREITPEAALDLAAAKATARLARNSRQGE